MNENRDVSFLLDELFLGLENIFNNFFTSKNNFRNYSRLQKFSTRKNGNFSSTERKLSKAHKLHEWKLDCSHQLDAQKISFFDTRRIFFLLPPFCLSTPYSHEIEMNVGCLNCVSSNTKIFRVNRINYKILRLENYFTEIFLTAQQIELLKEKKFAQVSIKFKEQFWP